MKFYDEMKPKFLKKFGYELLGYRTVSIEEATNQVKIILAGFDEGEKQRNKNQ